MIKAITRLWLRVLTVFRGHEDYVCAIHLEPLVYMIVSGEYGCRTCERKYDERRRRAIQKADDKKEAFLARVKKAQ